MTSERAPYSIKVAARLAGLHEQSLRMYERRGLIRPARTPGNVRRFSEADLEQIRLIKRLVDDLGVNLAGVEVIISLRRQLIETRRELDQLRSRIGAAVYDQD